MNSTQADLGVDYAAFANWSNGPAHLTWSRGQSTHGVGGPLPRTFADAQLALAKRILARMRGLGVVPVLPSFQGNVPPALKDRFPEANITVQAPHWTSGAVAWLDAGQEKRAKFPTSKAPISAVFHSFRLIFGRAIISWNGLEAWMLFPERARAEHPR